MMPRTAPAAMRLISAAPAGVATMVATTSAARARGMTLGVPNVARQHARTDADLLHRTVVFRADVGAEDQFGVRAAMQPAVLLQLVLELARRPAGVAQRQDRAGRTVAACDRLENVE